jgi:riboflavin kinase/FMN adenylyltransferase
MVMEIVYSKQKEILPLKNCCVALGYFDGLHVGHQKLLSKVFEISKKTGLKKVLMTFDKHPKEVLEKITLPYLTTQSDKIKILESYGFDYLIIVSFDETFSKLLPQQFIQQYIIQNQIPHIVCGFDYHFGYLGKGDIALLEKESTGYFKVTVVDQQGYQEHKISTTYIKSLLQEGKVTTVHTLLQRPYSITGEVIYGYQRGKKELGFPTANVDYKNYVVPQIGVYGVKVMVGDTLYLGMANIGYNPTFGDIETASLEVHIFDFDQNIYGTSITVLFYMHLRGEVRFSSKEALIKQLQKDRSDITMYFRQQGATEE